MYVHEALRLRLLDDAGVTAITEQIYLGVLSQGVEFPALAIRHSDKTTEQTLNTENRGHPGVSEFRYTFFSTCRDENPDVAVNLDEAVRLCLEGFQGTITDTDSSPDESVEIQDIFHEGTFYGHDDETDTHQMVTSYRVIAAETRPY